MADQEKVKLPTYETLLTEVIRSLAIDSGTVSVPPPAGVAVLQDDSKNWSVDVHWGRLVKIIRGAGAGQTRVIQSNSDRLLTLDAPWTVQLNQTSLYVILGEVLRQVLRDVLGGGSDISAANPLETHDPKVGSLISYEGETTADGAPDGSTLVCSDLTTKPDFDGHWVVITSGSYSGQARDITGATTGGTVTVSEAFDGQITTGTKFVILAMKALPAEVAAIEAKLDHATHGLAALKTLIDAVEGKLDGVSGLAALKAVVDAILVDTGTTLEDKLDALALVCTAARLAELDAANIPSDVDTIKAVIGAIEGATTLHNKLTAARAALLDQITAARMAELDAANLPADIDTIKAQTAKLAGAVPVVGASAAINWNTSVGTSGEAGEDLVTIGADNVLYKVLSLVLNVSALTAASVITVKMFQQINGVEKKVYSEGFVRQAQVQGSEPDGLWIISGVLGIHEALRVEVHSSTNEEVAIGYDYMLEAM
jgi:hypothetical protein